MKNNETGKTETNWVATGFLFGYRNNKFEADKYNVYIVTNRHVFKNKNKVNLLFNPQDGKPAQSFTLDLEEGEKKLYSEHPDPKVDIAVALINLDVLNKNNIKYDCFLCDKETYCIEELKDSLQSTEGDGVYALGYPMGLVGSNRQYVILRGGFIARIHDMLEGNSSDYVIDTLTFPGNSGGPVISRPEIASIGGTKNTTESRLIGVVKGYLLYSDYAISPQTKHTRVVFEENTGLTKVEPVDHIIETIETIEKGHIEGTGTV